MNRGIVIKSVRELVGITLIFGVVVAFFAGFLAYILPTYAEELSDQMLQIGFVRLIVSGMLGVEVTEGIAGSVFESIGWAHPVVLAVVWAHAIIACTRIPAAELDQGTIDVLLGLPVSRRQIFVSDAVVWMAAGALLLAMMFAGHRVGSLFIADADRAPIGRGVVITANLYCLYLAVAGLAALASSISDRRGRAIMITFIVLLASFLVNFLAQFWAPFETISFLSVLSYYRPIMVQGNQWPLGDMAVLLAVGATAWTAAALVFARRNLSAT